MEGVRNWSASYPTMNKKSDFITDVASRVMGLGSSAYLFDMIEEDEFDPVYKLTDEDVEELLEIGADPEDINQIREVAAVVKLTYKWKYDNGEVESGSISAPEAISIIGKHKFLCGLDRCAFHRDAVQTNEDASVIISFDAYAYFR